VARGALVTLLTALVVAAGPALAGTTPPSQPDVVLQQQGDEYFVGRNLYSPDGDGQSRSAIVRETTVIVVHIQNDGDERGSFTVSGSAAEDGYDLTYLLAGEDVTSDVVAGDLEVTVGAGKRRVLRVEVDATDADFAAVQLVLVAATSTSDSDTTDAARVEVTNITQA
jgi:hypothetical protein